MTVDTLTFKVKGSKVKATEWHNTYQLWKRCKSETDKLTDLQLSEN